MEATTAVNKRLFGGKKDFKLIIAILALCAFGMVMVFSASYYYALVEENDGLYYVKRQLFYLAAGLIGMVVFSVFDYHAWKKLCWPAVVVTVVLIAITAAFGKEVYGATRWLKIGGYTVQPSELAKFAMALFMAKHISDNAPRMREFKYGVLYSGAVLVAMGATIYFQRNLSTIVIVCLTWGVMLFFGGASGKHLLLMAVVGIAFVVVAVIAEEYRQERFIFVDPWQDPQGEGYQLVQSLYALGNGGLFGQGLSFSRQKLLFLPMGESDFIFSIIGEELGFVGCVALIAAYCFIIVRGYRIALRCRDSFGGLFAAGITSVLAIQTIVHIGVATSSLPTTGQTLPFVSVGGTALTVMLCAMGILINISGNIITDRTPSH